MGKRYLLGVDIGTSGSKGVLVDLAGKVVAYKSLQHGVDSPKPGWYEHDADAVWWADLKQITRALVAEGGVDAGAIAAVGISALSPEMLPLDADGRPLRKGILYCDGRAQKQIDEIVARAGEEGSSLKLTRLSLSSHYVGPKILWFRENEPALFERTRKILSATSYLVFKLTGVDQFDYTDAAGFSPLFDPEKLQWDRAVCKELGLSPDILAAGIACATDVAGEVTAEAAAETGLAEGTLVITGTCDAVAEYLSVGAVEEGEASLLYGTTMCMGINVSEEQKRAGVWAGPGAIRGTYSTGLGMSASGALTRWFRDNFGQVEQEVEEKLGISAYQLFSAQAADVPAGSEGLIVLPYFAGERSPIYDNAARGLIIGLTLSHTRKHIYRALLEGVAYGLRHSIEMLEAQGVQIKRMTSTGGGSRSKVWTQIVSDVIGMDQDVIVNPIGAPYGDAFIAGYGAGIFKEASQLRTDWAPAMTKVRHDPGQKRIYDKYYAVYRGLYEKNKDSMHTLAELAVSA